MRKKPVSGTAWVIRILLLIGFLVMEFPGVLFFKDMAEPYIFGMPFAYGLMLIGWIYMCIILYIARAVNWGEERKDGDA